MQIAAIIVIALWGQLASGSYYEGLRRKFTITTTPASCLKVTCPEPKQEACATVGNNSYILCPSCCSKGKSPQQWVEDNAECVVGTNWKGNCYQRLEFTEPLRGFPGEKCERNEECLFASRKCGPGGVCEGVARYGACRQSADCIFQHFCSYGHCEPILQEV